MPIVIDFDVMLARRKKAVRFSTLDALCEVLECQPGDLLRWVPAEAEDVVPSAEASG